MWEAIQQLFLSGDIWAIIVKVLVTAILSAVLGLLGTLIGKLVVKNKNSKIYKYAKTCVEAAEQKYPNEGKKMGPEKMAYVMDQLAIKFPKIKENTYLYNIAEAAVYELNKESKRQAAIEEFEQKYGEKPLAVQDDVSIDVEGDSDDIPEETEDVINTQTSTETTDVEETVVETKTNYTKLTSF